MDESTLSSSQGLQSGVSAKEEQGNTHEKGTGNSADIVPTEDIVREDANVNEEEHDWDCLEVNGYHAWAEFFSRFGPFEYSHTRTIKKELSLFLFFPLPFILFPASSSGRER